MGITTDIDIIIILTNYDCHRATESPSTEIPSTNSLYKEKKKEQEQQEKKRKLIKEKRNSSSNNKNR